MDAKDKNGVPVQSVHITDKDTDEELGVVDFWGDTGDMTEEEMGRRGAEAFRGFRAAEESLDPERLKEIPELMPIGDVLDLAALEIIEHILPAYSEKVEAALNNKGIKAVDISLPHLKPTTDKEGKPKVEIVLEDKDLCKIQGRVREILNEFPEPALEFARFAWTHIIAWARALMEQELDPDKLESLSDQEFDDTLHKYIFDKNPEPFEDRRKLLAYQWAEGLGLMVIDEVDPASRSIEELEAFMGLRPDKPPAPLEAGLFEVAEYVKTSNAPITESTRQAITKPSKWYTGEDGIPGFTFPRKTGQPVIYGLDWPAQFEPKGKLDLAYARREILGEVHTARLEVALEAYAEQHGSKETFYIDGDSLFTALGLPAHLSRGEKLGLVDKHARRVSFLRVNPVTNIEYLASGKGKYKGKPVRVYTTREDFVWHIVIERKYQEPLGDIPEGERELTGLILAVTPGDCWRFFLDTKSPLYFYRWTAAPKLSPYTHYLASQMEPYLEHQCTINKARLPWTVRVRTLLEASLDGTPKRGGGYYDLAALRTGKPSDRRDVIEQWEEATLTLRGLGWSIEFDTDTYPEELRPAWALEDTTEKRRRPRGYWDKLMEAKVYIFPPPDITARYPKPEPKRQRALSITGIQLKEAREKAGLTQSQLAERLEKSRQWVSLVEIGKRNISAKDARIIKRELGL